VVRGEEIGSGETSRRPVMDDAQVIKSVRIGTVPIPVVGFIKREPTSRESAFECS